MAKKKWKKRILVIFIIILCIALIISFVFLFEKKRYEKKDKELVELYREQVCEMVLDRLEEKYDLEGKVVECKPAYTQGVFKSFYQYMGYFDVKVEIQTDAVNMEVYPETGIIYDDYQAEIFYRDFQAYFLENMDIPVPCDIDVYISSDDERDGMLEDYYQHGEFFEAVPKMIPEEEKYREVPCIYVDIKYVEEKPDMKQIFSSQLKDLFGEYPVCVRVWNFTDTLYVREGLDREKKEKDMLISFYEYKKDNYDSVAEETTKVWEK